jgi:hypothetical protein
MKTLDAPAIYGFWPRLFLYAAAAVSAFFGATAQREKHTVTRAVAKR